MAHELGIMRVGRHTPPLGSSTHASCERQRIVAHVDPWLMHLASFLPSTSTQRSLERQLKRDCHIEFEIVALSTFTNRRSLHVLGLMQRSSPRWSTTHRWFPEQLQYTPLCMADIRDRGIHARTSSTHWAPRTVSTTQRCL